MTGAPEAAQEGVLHLEVVRGDALPPAVLSEIVSLCTRAYGEDMAAYFAAMPDPTHVFGRLGEVIVSHAMWVTRWLQPGDGPLLRTAYVEMVATEPARERRGYSSAVMRRLVESIDDFDLGGLCPSEAGLPLYERLGWELWRGPLSIRTANGPLPTPTERIMILRLPKTPPLDLDLPVSAEWREGDLW